MQTYILILMTEKNNYFCFKQEGSLEMSTQIGRRKIKLSILLAMKLFWQLLHKCEVFPANHVFQDYHLSIMQTGICMAYNKNNEDTHISLEEQWTSVPVVFKCSWEGTQTPLHLMELTLQVCSRLYCQAHVLTSYKTFKEPPMALAGSSDTAGWIRGGSSSKWCTVSIQCWQSMALKYSVIKSELYCTDSGTYDSVSVSTGSAMWMCTCIREFSL